MKIAGIYVITDPDLAPERSHIDITREALAGGAKIVQLRDKSASTGKMIEVGTVMRKLISDAGGLFIVNDNLEAAMACNADGLHVGQGDTPAKDLLGILKGKLLGVSVSTLQEAIQAKEDGADYLGFGPIYSTSTKRDAGPVTGLQEIELIRGRCGLPVVAIGGINRNNLDEIARSGVDSAAVISAIACAPDMSVATKELVNIWNQEKPGRVQKRADTDQ